MLNDALKAAGIAGKGASRLAKLKKATDGVEAMFVKDLLAAMRKGMPKTSFGDSSGSEIYKDMFDQALADSLGRTGSLGISKVLYRQLSNQIIKQALAEGAAPTGTKKQ